MSDLTIQKTHDDHAHPDAHVQTPEQVDNAKFAMWLYLASEVIIFTVFIATYVVFRINTPEIVKAVHDELGVLLAGGEQLMMIRPAEPVAENPLFTIDIPPGILDTGPLKINGRDNNGNRIDAEVTQ